MTHRRQDPAPEQQLLLICAATRLSKAEVERARTLIERGCDWKRFMRLVLTHGVGGFVYRNLVREFPAVVPDGIISGLKSYVLANSQSNMSMLKALDDVHRLLDANGIRHGVFKGLVIDHMIYHDFSVRKCGDIDLLVYKRDFPRAKALFLSEGFQQTLPDGEEALYLQSGLWHEDRRLKVDLHWGIPPLDLGIRGNLLMNDLIQRPLDGVTVPSFIPEDMFIVLCVNAVKEYWNQMLYTYCDIREFLSGGIELNWGLLLKRAKALRCRRPMEAALYVVKALYGVSPPREVMKRMAPSYSANQIGNELIDNLLNSETTGLDEARLNPRHFRSNRDYVCALMDDGYRRFRYRYLDFLEPSASDREMLALPDALFFLYYLIRPLRVAGKYGLRVVSRLVGRQSG